jgi:hypothetical protein
VSEPSRVSDFAAYALRRHERRSAGAELAERSQELYERVTAKAGAARRRDFTRALEQGLNIDELAEAVGLEVEAIWEIVGQT